MTHVICSECGGKKKIHKRMVLVYTIMPKDVGRGFLKSPVVIPVSMERYGFTGNIHVPNLMGKVLKPT